jgi:hypothetical protein
MEKRSNLFGAGKKLNFRDGISTHLAMVFIGKANGRISFTKLPDH